MSLTVTFFFITQKNQRTTNYRFFFGSGQFLKSWNHSDPSSADFVPLRTLLAPLNWEEFAKLWQADPDDYWGYVTTCGTEGNLHAMLLAVATTSEWPTTRAKCMMRRGPAKIIAAAEATAATLVVRLALDKRMVVDVKQ